MFLAGNGEKHAIGNKAGKHKTGTKGGKTCNCCQVREKNIRTDSSAGKNMRLMPSAGKQASVRLRPREKHATGVKGGKFT